MILWKGEKIPIVYLLIYRLMKERSKNNFFISYGSVKKILNQKLYHFPRVYHHIILKEMAELKLIERIGGKNKMNFKLIGKDIDKSLNQYLSFF